MAASDSASILIVDDDPSIRRLLRRFLEGEGFRVEEAADAASYRDAASRRRHDLVLLDVALGGDSGLDLCREIAREGATPVIFVSGRSDVIDRVVGLELGADDYIAKPFELREVLARVRSVLRRVRAPAAGGDGAASGAGDAMRVVRFAGWRLDRALRTLTDPKGAPVDLTTGEFNLLATFVDHAHRPLTRDRLMNLLKGADWTPFDRSIDTQVGRLRRKIEADPRRPALIKSVRGVGYVFAADVERA